MRLHIRYVTMFAYGDEVWNSHNILRACPVTDDRQRATSYNVYIEPVASIRSHTDFWGTRVDSFSVRQPHDRLVVQAESFVDTEPPVELPDVTVDSLADKNLQSRHWMYLQPTTHTTWSERVATAAAGAAVGATTVREIVEQVGLFVYDSLKYSPGATEIGVSVDEVWEARAGVCQDFAHLTVAMLRSLGVPARYVSGYFYASDPSVADTPLDEPISVQTHAWVEAAIPGNGWLALDPTNGARIGERHVVIGRGRDYDDVTPLRGVYSGRTDAEVTVEVAMTSGSLGPRHLPVVQLTPPPHEISTIGQ